MLQPAAPHLKVRTCLSDSITCWTGNLPNLVIGSLLAGLASIVLPIFMAAFVTGILLMCLEGQDRGSVSLRTCWSPLTNRPLRFLFLSVWGAGGWLILAVLSVVFAFGILPTEVLPDPLARDIVPIKGFLREHLSGDIIRYLPGFQEPSYDWSVILPAIVLALLWCYALFFTLRCFYLPILVADRHLPVIDAYVESRNTVVRYGHVKHAAILVLALFVLSLASNTPEDYHIDALVDLLVFPFSMSLVSSAYRQTLLAEQRNESLHDAQYREMRDELQTAHDMQMDLLPDTPSGLTGYSVDGLLVPANNVGGDYFAYKWLDEEQQKFAIVIADVSGKAMEAAVTALRFNEMLRYEIRNRTDPIDIVAGLNDSLEGQIDTDTFITCCVAVVDIPSGSVELVNAGHCPPIQVGAQSRLAIPVELSGLPLGIPAVLRAGRTYESKTVTLSDGDALVFYSDGVIEARGPNGDMLEETRFISLLEEENTWKADGSAPVVKTVHRAVESFIRTAPRADDLTLIVLRRDVDRTPSETE